MKIKKSIFVSGYGDLTLEREGGEEFGVELAIDRASTRGRDDIEVAAFAFLYADEAKALRDALIELYPLEAQAQPAQPKPRYVVAEDSEFVRNSSYKGGEWKNIITVCREEPSTRQVRLATFVTREDAEAFAEAMNAK